VAHNEKGYAAQSIDDIRYDQAAGHYSVLVRWLGFDADDSTWEPLDIIDEDVPQKVTAFFNRQVSSPTVTAARHWLAARETPSPGEGSMAAISIQS
jgi:Chromo (CHRromatin Organisation MOdifier) domain